MLKKKMYVRFKDFFDRQNEINDQTIRQDGGQTQTKEQENKIWFKDTKYFEAVI